MLNTRSEAKLKGEKFYFTGFPCARGGVGKRRTSTGTCLCEFCIKEKNERNKICMAKAYELNPDGFKKKSSEYYSENKNNSSFSEKRKKYRVQIKESQNKYNKEYRVNNQKKMRDLHRIWRNKNPVNIACRRLIYRLVNENGIKKTDSTLSLLGYTHNDLRLRMESLFDDGMSWENYGEWHIDHIKPISIMIKEGETSPAIINALSNLRPLWAKDNISKGCRWQE